MGFAECKRQLIAQISA